MPVIPNLPTRELADKATETTTRVLEQVRTLTDVMSRHAAALMPQAPGLAGAEAMKEAATRFARTPGALAQDTQAYVTDAAQRADVIAMSTHARRGVARALMGSVAEEVVRLKTADPEESEGTSRWPTTTPCIIGCFPIR